MAKPLYTVKLQVPISVEGEVTDTLAFTRRVTLGDLIEAEDARNDVAKLAVLVSRLAGITVKEAHKLDAMDLEEVGKAVEFLTEGATAGPPAGGRG